MPPKPPPFQFGFLHEGPHASYLKVAQTRFTNGIILTTIGGVGGVLMVGFGAGVLAHASTSVLALLGIYCLLTGARTIVDKSAKVLHTHGGACIPAAEIEGFAMTVEQELNLETTDSWGQLYAIRRGGEAVLIAQSITPDKLLPYGKELAASFGVPWRSGAREP